MVDILTSRPTLILTALLGAAFVFTPAHAEETTMTISSPDFKTGSSIPPYYSCRGANVSPALRWEGVPAGAKSLALLMRDPDAPRGTFVHWVIFNLPPSVRRLHQGITPDAKLGGQSAQGDNGAGKLGYTGPCPPSGVHHYHFLLLALDNELNLKPGATASEVEAASKGHVLARGELVGTFGR